MRQLHVSGNLQTSSSLRRSLHPAEWSQQLRRSYRHEIDFGACHEKLKSLFGEGLNLFGTTGRPAKEFPVFLRRGCNSCHCFVEPRVILSTAQTQREGKIAGPDEQDI